MEETESLVDNIAKEVGVSEEVANQAVEKIDIAIFDPLRKIISSDNSKEASPSSKVEERLENIVSTPNTPAGSERDKRYPGGSDPYREPFE